MSQSTCSGCVEYESQVETLQCEKDRWLAREKELELALKTLSSQVQSIQGKFTVSQLDLMKANEELQKMNVLKDAEVEWQKKIITLGELYQKTREQLDALTSNHFIKANSKDSLQLKFDACKRDLDKTCVIRDKRTAERDFHAARQKETEELNTRLQQEITDLHRSKHQMITEFKAQLDLKQKRIDSLEHIHAAFIKKIQSMNRQLNRPPLALPALDSLVYEPETELGETEDISDLTSHSNNHT